MTTKRFSLAAHFISKEIIFMSGTTPNDKKYDYEMALYMDEQSKKLWAMLENEKISYAQSTTLEQFNTE